MTNDDVTRDWLGDPDGTADPVRAARQGAKPALPKRFYKEAGIVEAEDGFRLVLDGRPAHSPTRRRIAVRQRALAEALAAEWGAQDERQCQDDPEVNRTLHHGGHGAQAGRVELKETQTNGQPGGQLQ